MKPKISLCVIAGNVENQIGRFLDAFSPVADEVIVVSAIGNQEFDRTPQIVAERGCVWSCYENRVDWPHVDDFAAARNKACDMATGDWLMWADTDDIITPDSVDQIKRLIADIHEKDVDGVLMRYVVPEDGVINWRERLWRKGRAMWNNPIHECLEFVEGATHMRFDGAEIVHASEKRSAARDERNLRILESIPEDEQTVSQKFHVFQTLIALDRNDDATIKAIEFVSTPEVGKNERYEAFFQLARLAGDEETKVQMLLQALATDPTRREAYGELGLANVAIDPTAALGWTEAMLGLKLPEDAPWNLRRTYYGHLGISLRAMALRVNGRGEEADAIETNHFLRSGAKISLLHATRGRPGKAWLNRMHWIRMATNPDAIEHIFSIDIDDKDSFLLGNARCVVNPVGGGSVAAWNAAAKLSKGEVLVQMSDDFEAFPGWDVAILDAIGDTSKPAVLAVSDGMRTDELLCMAIVTRARYKAEGYLFHPDFFSVFSDDWFSNKAWHDGVVIDARDKITFEHMHPAFDKSAWDETYERGNNSRAYQTGKRHLDRLMAGRSTSWDVHGWCNYRPFYAALAETLPSGSTFVEIGCWMGQSIIHFAQRCQDLGKEMKIFVVDTFQGEEGQTVHIPIVEAHGGSVLETFKANIKAAGVDHMITIVQSDSAEAAAQFKDSAVDGLYFDAAHEYEPVCRDLDAWIPKVKKGGILSGHDYQHEPVRRAVDEAMERNGWTINTIGNVWIRDNK